MDGDWPLPNLRFVISGATLTGLIGVRFWKLAGEHDVTVGPPGRRDFWCLADVAKFDEHRMGVVLRHNPTAHHGTAKGMLLMAIFPHWGHLLQVGQHRFDHPSPDVPAHAPGRDIDHPGRGLEEIQFWHLTKLVSKLRARNDGMEKGRVHGVHGIFQDLQPVARIEILLAGDEPVARSVEAIVTGEGWLLVRWSHVGKHDALILVGRVGAVTEPVFQRALYWLAWGLQ